LDRRELFFFVFWLPVGSSQRGANWQLHAERNQCDLSPSPLFSPSPLKRGERSKRKDEAKDERFRSGRATLHRSVAPNNSYEDHTFAASDSLN